MAKGIFNIRVYGLIINEQQQVLLTDEHRFGHSFTKFPGGGLEYGEGIKDCLYREMQEELGMQPLSAEHFYTTDFFQDSAFHTAQQIISIYYRVQFQKYEDIEVVDRPFAFPNGQIENAQVFRWQHVLVLHEDMLSFPIDKHVARRLRDFF